MKKTYIFTLILRNLDENTPGLEDSLYEAGCDDALINFRNGAVYLDFEREASSLELAVMSAIKDVESSSVDAIVAKVAPEDLVTESEVATRLHVKRQAVFLWMKGQRRKNKIFPRPIMKLNQRSPLWRWREIVEWLYQNHILVEKDMLVDAIFMENINIILEERETNIKKSREALRKRFNTLIPIKKLLHKEA